MRYTGSSVCRRCGLSLPDRMFPNRPTGHRGFVCSMCIPPIDRRQLDKTLEEQRLAAVRIQASKIMSEPTKVCKRCGETKPNDTAHFPRQVFLAKGVHVTADTCKACRGAAISHGHLKARLEDEAYRRFKVTGEVGETLLQRLDRERLERERIAAARAGGTADQAEAEDESDSA